MDFGLFMDFRIRRGMTQVEAFEESFDQVEMAEKLGIDTLWLGEFHFRPERSVLASPIVIASAIASRTSRVRIGLAVQVLPLSNPLRIAEEAATVDHISRGRFDFGIGRSGVVRSYRGYNIPYTESRARFFESLDVIMKAWGEEQFSHKGEYYSFQNVSLVPKPYQRPHPPTRVAAASADTYALMGSMGYPIFVGTNTPMAQLRDRLEEYRKAWQSSGHPGSGDVVLRLPAYVAETKEKARSEPEISTIQEIKFLAEELSAAAASQEAADRLRSLAGLPYDDILSHRVMYGTPDAVIERLQEYEEELGISGVVMEMNYGGQVPYSRVVNSMRLLIEKVVPEFK